MEKIPSIHFLTFTPSKAYRERNMLLTFGEYGDSEPDANAHFGWFNWNIVSLMSTDLQKIRYNSTLICYSDRQEVDRVMKLMFIRKQQGRRLTVALLLEGLIQWAEQRDGGKDSWALWSIWGGLIISAGLEWQCSYTLSQRTDLQSQAGL